MYPYILFAAFLQAPALPVSVPLLEDCSADSRVIALLQPSERVEVHSSLSGDTATCYAVTASVGGQNVEGHVLGDSLASVREFERQRREALSKPPAPPAAPTVAKAAPQLPLFPDFSGVDVKDRRLNFASWNGKLILVCFWSPRDQESARELLVVNRLYGNLHRQGLEALGVSLDRQRAEILDSMEDFDATFPNVADWYGLADRMRVSDVPYTFILNQQHEIVASGLHGRNLEATVQKLMAGQ